MKITTDSDSAVVVAGSIGTSGVAVLSLNQALQDLFDRPPRTQFMPGLAGPNDTLQLLMSWQVWVGFASGMLTVYSTELAKLAAQDSYKAIKNWISKPKPELEPQKDLSERLSRVEQAIDEAVRGGNTVVLGFPLPESGFKQRNIGIELIPNSRDDYFRTVTTLALIGEDLASVIAAEKKKGHTLFPAKENADCSGKIELLTDGSVVVHLLASPTKNLLEASPLTIRYNPEGKRIE